MTVFVLTTHGTYGCRERGACCTAGWPIAVSEPERGPIEMSIQLGRIGPRVDRRPFFERDAGGDGRVLTRLAVHAGACAFYRPSGAGCCEIHRALGHGALPLACRQFPRVSVHEPRGTAVTLSHYCPTAAGLLEADVSIAIMTNAPGFPAGGEYVGLDARSSLPPLLQPDMLMDWESWWAFERRAIGVIERASSTAESLARLAGAVESVRAWRPNDGPLIPRVADAFERGPSPVRSPVDLVEAVRQSIPADLRPPRPALRCQAEAPAVRRRFMAAHTFANWTAHLGRGLRTWLASVAAADGLLAHGLTVREADLWLRHLVDPNVLAERLSTVERA